jgi:hypothetical protein
LDAMNIVRLGLFVQRFILQVLHVIEIGRSHFGAQYGKSRTLDSWAPNYYRSDGNSIEVAYYMNKCFQELPTNGV